MNTATIPEYHAEWTDEQQRAVRNVLREQIRKCSEWETSDISADCIIEQTWNAIVTAHGQATPDY